MLKQTIHTLLLPKRIIDYLIRVQEARTYSFWTIFSFAVFTGFFRGIEEVVFFAIRLKNSEIFTFVHFYLGLAFTLTLVLAFAGNLKWQKVNSAVVIGIFLGIFPPLIDKLFNPRTDIFYGFFFLWNFSELPWLGFKPEFNFPLGESVTIWLSIFFSAYYIAYRTRNLLRTFIAAVGAYATFILFGSIVPILITRLTVGLITTPEEAKQVAEASLRSVVYYNALAQVTLATLAYLVMRLPVLKLLTRRSLHVLPFVLISILGSLLNGPFNGDATMAAGLVFWMGWVALLQNDFYDLSDDRSRNPANLSVNDIYFANTTFLLGLVTIFFIGQRLVMPLAIVFIVSVLYNYPFYRAKKSFPGNLKIEGIWGLCAFLTGALANSNGELANPVLLVALLVFGGWSLIASLKDAKDLRRDQRAGTRTLYTILIAQGFRFTKIHQLLLVVCFCCFLIPPLGLMVAGAWPAAVALTCTTVVAYAILSRRAPSGKWFTGVLLFISTYLSLVIVIFSYGVVAFR